MNPIQDLSDPLWTLLVSAVGLLAGPVLARISHRRALAQPTPAHPDIEPVLIDSVLSRPALYVYIHQLEPQHFALTRQQQRWQTVKEALNGIDIPDVSDTSKKSYQLLATAESLVPDDLLERTGLVVETGSEQLIAEPQHLVSQGSLVYSAGLDRAEFAGNSRIEQTDDSERPLIRLLDPPNLRRKLTASILAAFGSLVSALTVPHAVAGTGATVLALGALLALTAGSVIWALVDLDTMYIDTRSFILGAGVAWALAAGALWADERTADAAVGIAGAGGIVLFIEIINQLYRRIRGHHGMGMGDYILIVATIGVPVALIGNWQLAQVILIVSLLAGIVGWTLRRVREEGFGRDTPYAFGPYLATGWMIALLLWSVTR